MERNARSHAAGRQPEDLRPSGHGRGSRRRRSARDSRKRGARGRGRRPARGHLARRSSAMRRCASSRRRIREGLEILRHSTAHLLAQAVQSIYPKAQVTIGPVIDDGFYYDFAFERPFTPEDLAQFEQKMREIVKADQPVRRRVLVARRRGRALQVDRRALQGRDHRGDPGRRGDLALRPGRLGRPLPRAARAVDRQARRVQADQGRRRLLARRFAQRDAPAHLRHGLARRQAARRTT